MSGDVQPRKRNKDKKRRREDSDAGRASFEYRKLSMQDDEDTRPTGVHPTKMGPDDIQLHVHSEHGTGGHWCAKIFFFSLLAILLGLIGLILLENRGLSDLDTPLSESRFADMLEGWVDEEREVHDEHDVHAPPDSHNEHDEHEDGEDNIANSQENEEDEHDEDEAELTKDDADNDDEKDEGFDESGETEDSANADNDDDENDERLSKSAKLTIDAVIDDDIPINSHATNTKYAQNIKKRSIDTSTIEDIAQVTVSQLKKQVDDLVDNYNKLAKTLNRSQLHDTNTRDVKRIARKMDENNDEDDNPADLDDDDDDENEDKEVDDNDDDEDEGIADDDKEQADDDDDNNDDSPTLDDDNDDDSPAQDDDNDDDSPALVDDGHEIDNDNDSDSPALDDDGNEIEPEPQEEDEGSSQIDRSGPAAIPTEDQLLDDEIRRANEQLAEDPQSALTQFERIRQSHPTSVAAQYGLAKALDDLADLKRSNGLLKRAIDEYGKYIDFGVKLNDTEFKSAAERCIDRMRFIGEHIRAVPIHEKLIERFDDDPYYRNQLAVTYLLVNRLADAKYVLHMTLQRWRDDGFAAVHYGFVLKNLDNNLEHAVIFLRQGIDSGENGTSDGRFYFHLGDALIRLGRHDRAKEVFKEAAKKKLFPSEYQRSLYNVNHLKAKPFWTLAETGYKHEFRTLEQNWEKIRDEGLSLLSKDGFFTDEAENLRDTGIWKQFEMFARGKRNAENCKRTPFTCKVIETFPAARFCKRGQVKFSVMHPNTHVWPHCGPTNCRLRAHLGLKTTDKTSIRVATETRTWNEGKFMVFDDSFEHEVWHNGTTYRLILIVDVWHPDLTAEEKQTLVPI
ncbi:aspartyl/asparaginyl beta-hydroxylase isoform X7 [Sitodiplosis mosellana]|uniref:aspartyl/asparaginyl beta-hydroxylase isoform X7 n=1 Tax=Sitodiplosis mosellana TaxID=263140 RepID=UPI002443E5DA|nr:aspartyl/asparaginyl beta-hydroxylase isoform X7 [Sitodiplosis mosellana]